MQINGSATVAEEGEEEEDEDDFSAVAQGTREPANRIVLPSTSTHARTLRARQQSVSSAVGEFMLVDGDATRRGSISDSWAGSPVDGTGHTGTAAAYEAARVQSRLARLGVFVEGVTSNTADPDLDTGADQDSDDEAAPGLRHARVQISLAPPSASTGGATATLRPLYVPPPRSGVAAGTVEPVNPATGAIPGIPGSGHTAIEMGLLPDSNAIVGTAATLSAEATAAAAAVSAGSAPSAAGSTGVGSTGVRERRSNTVWNEQETLPRTEVIDVQDVDDVTAMLLRSPDSALTLSAPYTPGSYTTLMASLHHMWGTFSRTRKQLFFRQRVAAADAASAAAAAAAADVMSNLDPEVELRVDAAVKSMVRPPSLTSLASLPQPNISGTGSGTVSEAPIRLQPATEGGLAATRTRLRVATGSAGGSFVDLPSQVAASYAANVFSAFGGYSNSDVALERVAQKTGLNYAASHNSISNMSNSNAVGTPIVSTTVPPHKPLPPPNAPPLPVVPERSSSGNYHQHSRSNGLDSTSTHSLGGLNTGSGSAAGRKRRSARRGGPKRLVSGSSSSHSLGKKSVRIKNRMGSNGGQDSGDENEEEDESIGMIKIQDMLVMNHFFFNFDRYVSRMVHKVAPHAFPHMYPLSTLVTTLPVALAHADDIMPTLAAGGEIDVAEDETSLADAISPGSPAAAAALVAAAAAGASVAAGQVTAQTLFGLGLGSVTRYVPLPAPVPGYYKPPRLATLREIVEFFAPYCILVLAEFVKRCCYGTPTPVVQQLPAVQGGVGEHGEVPAAPAPVVPASSAQAPFKERFRQALGWLLEWGPKQRKLLQLAIKITVAHLVAALTVLVPWPFTIYQPQWAPLTVGFAFSESIGGGLVMAMNRIMGNVFGAMYGYVTAAICYEIDPLRGETWALANIGMLSFFALISGYVRSSPRHGGMGLIMSFAANTIALGYDPKRGANDYALARIQMIMLGILAATIVAAIMWPERAETSAFKRIARVLKESVSCLELNLHLLNNHSAASAEISEIVFGPTLLPALSADDEAVAESRAAGISGGAADTAASKDARGSMPVTALGLVTAVPTPGLFKSPAPLLNPFAANSAMRHMFRVIFPETAVATCSSTSFMAVYEREVAAKLAAMSSAIADQRTFANDVLSEPALFGRSLPSDILHEVITHQVTLVRVLGRMQECLFAHHWVISRMPKVARVDRPHGTSIPDTDRIRGEAVRTATLMSDLVSAACRILIVLIHDVNRRVEHNVAGLVPMPSFLQVHDVDAPVLAARRSRKKRGGCPGCLGPLASCLPCKSCCCDDTKSSAHDDTRVGGRNHRRNRHRPDDSEPEPAREQMAISANNGSNSGDLEMAVLSPVCVTVTLSPAENNDSAPTQAPNAPLRLVVAPPAEPAASGVSTPKPITAALTTASIPAPQQPATSVTLMTTPVLTTGLFVPGTAAPPGEAVSSSNTAPSGTLAPRGATAPQGTSVPLDGVGLQAQLQQQLAQLNAMLESSKTQEQALHRKQAELLSLQVQQQAQKQAHDQVQTQILTTPAQASVQLNRSSTVVGPPAGSSSLLPPTSLLLPPPSSHPSRPPGLRQSASSGNLSRASFATGAGPARSPSPNRAMLSPAGAAPASSRGSTPLSNAGNGAEPAGSTPALALAQAAGRPLTRNSSASHLRPSPAPAGISPNADIMEELAMLQDDDDFDGDYDPQGEIDRARLRRKREKARLRAEERERERQARKDAKRRGSPPAACASAAGSVGAPSPFAGSPRPTAGALQQARASLMSNGKAYDSVGGFGPRNTGAAALPVLSRVGSSSRLPPLGRVLSSQTVYASHTSHRNAGSGTSTGFGPGIVSAVPRQSLTSIVDMMHAHNNSSPNFNAVAGNGTSLIPRQGSPALVAGAHVSPQPSPPLGGGTAGGLPHTESHARLQQLMALDPRAREEREREQRRRKLADFMARVEVTAYNTISSRRSGTGATPLPAPSPGATITAAAAGARVGMSVGGHGASFRPRARFPPAPSVSLASVFSPLQQQQGAAATTATEAGVASIAGAPVPTAVGSVQESPVASDASRSLINVPLASAQDRGSSQVGVSPPAVQSIADASTAAAATERTPGSNEDAAAEVEDEYYGEEDGEDALSDESDDSETSDDESEDEELIARQEAVMEWATERVRIRQLYKILAELMRSYDQSCRDRITRTTPGGYAVLPTLFLLTEQAFMYAMTSLSQCLLDLTLAMRALHLAKNVWD